MYLIITEKHKSKFRKLKFSKNILTILPIKDKGSLLKTEERKIN